MLNVPDPAFAVTVPLTGWTTAEPSTLTAVALAPVFASETCTGVAEVPISVPDWFLKLMCSARLGVMRAEAACPAAIAAGGESSKSPPAGLMAVVPVVKLPLSANPAEDEQPESQVTCRLLPVACATVNVP